tara:strand:- start:9865 stop:10416 length:552 start_codon:yes stop_codon:yes gene_type:complete
MAETILSGDTAGVVQNLSNFLEEHGPAIKSRIKTPLACFDVDETLLEWGADDSSRRREEVATLFNLAVKEGYKIYIITARDKSQSGLAYLKTQLASLGFDTHKIEKIYMMPSTESDVGQFKSDARSRIIQQTGGKFVIMVGDQMTDVFRAPGSLNANRDFAHVFAAPDDGVVFGVKVSEMQDV